MEQATDNQISNYEGSLGLQSLEPAAFQAFLKDYEVKFQL